MTQDFKFNFSAIVGALGKTFDKSKLALAMGAIMLVGCLSSHVYAQSFDMGSGWTGDIGLQIQAFAVSTDDSENDTDSGESTRIMSGFDPSKLTIGVTAPETHGVTVSGTYQVVQAINDGKTKGDGANSSQFSVRIAELAIGGVFGTVKAGRGWSIFSSSSLSHDSGSLPGVGGSCGGGNLAGFGGGGCGRIGYGYQWTDFDSHLSYASPNWGGFSFRVGAFDPIETAGGDTAQDPRVEGEVNYSRDMFDVWASFAIQDTEGESEISAWDAGAEIRFGGLAITGAYTDGTGIDVGIMSPSENDTEMIYGEADFTIGDVLLGVSYGTHELTNSSGDTTQEGALAMAFVHYNLTPKTILIVEYSNEEVEDGDGNTTFDADTFALGAQIVF